MDAESGEKGDGSWTSAAGTEGGSDGASASEANSTAMAGGSVCSPTGLPWEEFIEQPNVSREDDVFGLTRLEHAKATYPTVRVTPAGDGDGVRVRPTMATFPEIQSVYVGGGSFIDGTETYRGRQGRRERRGRSEGTYSAVCQTGEYPVKWIIDGDGADLIRQGEQEHCDDFRYAYDVSLARYTSAVNELAGSGATFPDRVAAERHLEQRVGVAPSDWRVTFKRLTEKTEKRDDNEWHTPKPNSSGPWLANCQHFLNNINKDSLPEVGKHPSSEIIK